MNAWLIGSVVAIGAGWAANYAGALLKNRSAQTAASDMLVMGVFSLIVWCCWTIFR